MAMKMVFLKMFCSCMVFGPSFLYPLLSHFETFEIET